jgi:hypothetical protein
LSTGLLSSEQRKLLDLATERYAGQLDLALPYLETRGIDRASALTRGLGVVTDPVVGHQAFMGRMSIPYITQAGTVNMTFRCIKDHDCKTVPGHKKYLKPKGLETTLYGVADMFKDTLDICLAEGELDAIVLSELVGLPSIGNPGSENWKPWWTDLLRDFRRVFVYCDGDESGRDMGERVQKELDSMAVVLIHLPDGEDVNSLYLKKGAQHLRELAK